MLYALFALPAAVIARRHILRWSRSEEPTGWQFSLKSLLIGVTVLAVVFACVGTIFYKNANGIAKPAPDDKAKRHLRIATTPHFDVHLQSKDVEIKGWVDTTTNTFTIASWHDTNKVSWTQAWTPQAKELPLVLLAYKQDGTPFDVPEDWDGQLSGFAFLLPADQDLLSVMWNEGTPTPFWKGASFGWGGLRDSGGMLELAGRTRFSYLPTVGGMLPTMHREYGPASVTITEDDGLFTGIEREQPVWMSHGDSITRLPEGFHGTAQTDSSPYAGFVDPTRNLHAIQFHPEVVHTPAGRQLLRNFVVAIAGIPQTWTSASFIDSTVSESGSVSMPTPPRPGPAAMSSVPCRAVSIRRSRQRSSIARSATG